MMKIKNYGETIVGASAVLIAGGLYFAATSSAQHLGGLTAAASQFFEFDRDAFWTFFAALFAIMNPVIAIPLFVRVSRYCGVSARRRLALVTSATVLTALVAAALLGQELLGFFAISIGSFRIAGGIIVLLMGLAMLQAKGEEAEPRTAAGDDSHSDSQAICPIAIPLLAGPGGIATIILQSQSASSPADLGMIGLAIALIVGLTYLVLRLAQPIARALGPTGLMVATRLIGMIVAAIAIDMMVMGLCLSFPKFL